MDTQAYLDHIGFSVRKLARESGIPRSTIKSILAGGGATADTIMKLNAFSGGLITTADLQRKKKGAGG